MSEPKKYAYVAWTNTDLTEGRGHEKPLAICESEATARRLGKGESVRGSNCRVEKIELVRNTLDSAWYGPVHIVAPSREDMMQQQIIDRRNHLIEKAKSLGMSAEEVAELASGRGK